MSEVIEVLQIPLWLLASLLSIKFTRISKEVNAWKVLTIGVTLGFFRVVWKFLPLYEVSISFQLFRYLIGAAAAVLISYGFFEYYVETTGLDMSSVNVEKTVAITVWFITFGYLIILISGLEWSVIGPIRLAEQVIWAVSMISSLVMIIKIEKIMSHEEINTGSIVLTLPVALLAVYYSMATYRRIYILAGLNIHPFIGNLAELIEGLSGLALAGAFMFIYRKSTSGLSINEIPAPPQKPQEIKDR